jgi:DNA polymerase-3 subunit epsilon
MRHELKANEKGFTCNLCGWQWTVKPVSDCPGVPRYTWNNKPTDLLAKSDLAQQGLEPPSSAHRRGVIWSVRESIFYDLFHVADARPITTPMLPDAVVPTNMRTLPASAAACQRCDKAVALPAELNADGLCADCEHDLKLAAARRNVIEWAKEMLAQDECLVVSIAIASDNKPEIIEVAVIDSIGNVLLNTLVRPTMPIPSEATARYGITDKDMDVAPAFPEVYGHLMSLVSKRMVIAYNAKETEQALQYTTELYQLNKIDVYWQSALEAFAAFYGEWSPDTEDFEVHPLERACITFEIDCTSLQESINSCQATLALIEALAQQTDG